ncbi:hypothetical protein C8A00DRAFT_30527 [Chaetomidium leptoderma]|uniref:Arginine--tRNA ligase n=1 Tax=Chaetomidium leptoderma TaxID=669021 RepID=A0AAN7A183_9PEZI|nr:hypothetical protein C8A00DRAFT_30527 [Chaetomidium leptoderma]
MGRAWVIDFEKQGSKGLGIAVEYTQVEDSDTVAEAVGIAGVIVQDISGKRINNYPFDITRMTSFEGDTGPYLQYYHTRLNSILRKAGIAREDLVHSWPIILMDWMQVSRASRAVLPCSA